MTPYSTVVNAFLSLVETDRDFFSYFRTDDETATQLVLQRSINFLTEAANRVVMECLPVVDFTIEDIDVVDGEVTGSFKFDLNQREIILLSNLMYEAYMFRDISSLKLKDVNFTGTEMRIFDPSNARKTYMTMYEAVCERNNYLIDIYKNTSREDGSYNMIDFDDYDTKKCIGGCSCR